MKGYYSNRLAWIVFTNCHVLNNVLSLSLSFTKLYLFREKGRGKMPYQIMQAFSECCVRILKYYCLVSFCADLCWHSTSLKEKLVLFLLALCSLWFELHLNLNLVACGNYIHQHTGSVELRRWSFWPHRNDPIPLIRQALYTEVSENNFKDI